MFPHLRNCQGEQVGVTFLAEAKIIEEPTSNLVPGSPETACTPSWNQIALQHQHLGPFGSQLEFGD